MKSVPKETLTATILITVITLIATILVATVDVKPIGVENTNIGFATINKGFYDRYGYNETFYKISKFAGYVCFAAAAGFAAFFAWQFIQRKSLSKVDRNLSILMLIYVVTAIIYILFNKYLIINYRPIMRDKGLESSYPSTHAMIAWVIMVSAVDQWNIYIKKQNLRTVLVILSFLVLMIVLVTRTLSGVHWITDISGGILFGDTLIAWYRYITNKK